MTAAYFYPQANMVAGGKGAKRRPGTASRKNQANFQKKQGFGAVQASLGGPPLSAKAASHIDLEVNKLRPRVIQQERERLYDDVMRQRMTTNQLKDENIRLKTKLHMVEVTLQRKDKLIDDLIQAQEASYGMPGGKRGVIAQKGE